MSIFSPKQEQELLKLVKTDCKSYNIKLYLSTGKAVRNNGHKCGGYFCSSTKKIAVAKGNPNWAIILLHEYCHLIQWRENCEAWSNSCRYRIDYMSEWLADSRYVSKAKLDEVFRTTMNVEQDCERRKIAYLKQLGISKKKIQEEIQKANAYVLFYMYVKKNQIWNLPKYPSRIKKIWSQCPKNFNYNFHKSFERVEHLYNYHL